MYHQPYFEFYYLLIFKVVFIFFTFIHLCTCVICASVCACMCVCVYMCKHHMKGKFAQVGSLLSLCRSWDQTRVGRLGGKFLSPLNHLTGPSSLIQSSYLSLQNVGLQVFAVRLPFCALHLLMEPPSNSLPTWHHFKTALYSDWQLYFLVSLNINQKLIHGLQWGQDPTS